MDKDLNSEIDALDGTPLLELYKQLAVNGCYAETLNLETIDEANTEQLRRVVKLGVQSINYEKLKQFAPASIKAHIEALEAADRQAQAPLASNQAEPVSEKEKLMMELVQIAAQRDARKRVPPSLRPRYSQIITQLSQIHNMTFKDISEACGMDRQTLSKDADAYIKEHPITTPDPKVLDKSTSHVVETLSKTVGKQADQIVEGDMELALHIREAYLKEAYMRGMTLRQLIDMAVPRFFKSDEIYNTMLEMERSNIELRNSNEVLTHRVSELTSKNKNLNRTLININNL